MIKEKRHLRKIREEKDDKAQRSLKLQNNTIQSIPINWNI